MGGGGKRRSTANNNNTNKNDNRNRTKRKPTGRIRESLFVEGGILSEFPPVSDRNSNVIFRSGSSLGNAGRTKTYSGSKNGPRETDGNEFRYVYPTVEHQEGIHGESSTVANSRDSCLDKSQPVVLVNSKDTKVVVYVDEKPSSKPYNFEETSVNYSSSSFVLGDNQSKALGFHDESNANPSGIGLFSKQEEDNQEGPFVNSSYSDEEMDGDKEYLLKETDTTETRNSNLSVETPTCVVSQEKNSAFLSIGGMKLFTEDISDGESDDDDEDVDDGDDESQEDISDSSEPGRAEESSESKVSDDTFDSDSEIDDELAEDYLEGIGGSANILESKWLVENNLNDSDEDTSSSDGFDETLTRLGGIALQDASSEYGMKRTRSKGKKPLTMPNNWSSALDDILLLRDPRTSSARKKHVPRLPQSWPKEAQRSKSSRNFPGAKKKHRKETIVTKRRERMLQRGVNLEKINMKLEHIVLNGADVFSFQPMHSRDCSQVRRLAAIYRLRSGCQGSGKKRFVTVTRTQHTCMPSASDRIRLEKLIGAGNEDTDFAVNEGVKTKLASGNKTKKIEKGSGLRPQKAQGQSSKKPSNRQNSGISRKHGGEKGFNANQPVSFVSSGVMESETVETAKVDFKESSGALEDKVVLSSTKVGAFELYTKGFGSKMMAKMGYVEGGGLGKDGQGMSQPIEVVQWPKSLGLGVDFSGTSDDPVKISSQRIERRVKPTKGQSFGAFEQHTKGFGSKMMAKMGFVEGMGLGKDSQGITNPLVAVRLPKSRGLGAKA